MTGSYWVWIPRYKYKITDKPGVNDTASAGIIDVKFISVEEKSGTSVYKTRMNDDGEFITQDDEGYIIHPAFEDGSSNGAKAQGQTNYVEYNNGEWDSELAGFWVSKYEMSMEDGNGNAVVPDSVTTGDVEISNSVKMVSKANRSSWRYISKRNSYKNCYNYSRINESHMIKNSEWGTVAFLTHSQYGRNGNEVAMSESYITANKGEIESTTGNIYGVYGMSGGAWESVAAWDTKSTSDYLSTYGNVIIDGYAYGVSGEVSTKYATAYENGIETRSGMLAKIVGKTGDAIKETYISGECLWFNDCGYFTCSTDPFFGRSNNYNSGNSAGVFCSYSATGEPFEWTTFRTVLSPQI